MMRNQRKVLAARWGKRSIGDVRKGMSGEGLKGVNGGTGEACGRGIRRVEGDPIGSS